MAYYCDKTELSIEIAEYQTTGNPSPQLVEMVSLLASGVASKYAFTKEDAAQECFVWFLQNFRKIDCNRDPFNYISTGFINWCRYHNRAERKAAFTLHSVSLEEMTFLSVENIFSMDDVAIAKQKASEQRQQYQAHKQEYIKPIREKVDTQQAVEQFNEANKEAIAAYKTKCKLSEEERQTNNRASRQRYYDRNKETIAQQKKDWYKANKETVCQQRRAAYLLKHPNAPARPYGLSEEEKRLHKKESTRKWRQKKRLEKQQGATHDP